MANGFNWSQKRRALRYNILWLFLFMISMLITPVYLLVVRFFL
jgi:hypothetical protein